MRHLVLLLLAASVLPVAACGDDDDGTAPESDGPVLAALGAADEGIEGVEAYRVSSADHTEGVVDYGVRPPPGGPHNPRWLPCGFHDEMRPDEHVVHTLEHGAVWLAYATDLPARDVDVLRDLTSAHDKVVATPYPDLPDGSVVVASAWARQLPLDSVTDPRLERFVVQYEDGSQAPEAGVTCE
jgi:hypothetical protein